MDTYLCKLCDLLVHTEEELRRPLGASLSSPTRPDILDKAQLLPVNNSSWGHLRRNVGDAEATACLATTCDATPKEWNGT
ncbi:hypothetical protein E2C01_034563 [Portunus trituberculatus]|uniref:Uncharacterized protein n=1 Tax=Portunus trituberculatus TaxID=210409 RepID=A0A5B7F7D2_PORTR|nr:hypothetical protein [Portunus trituberculatus]